MLHSYQAVLRQTSDKAVGKCQCGFIGNLFHLFPSENNAIITTMITNITRNRHSASSEGHRLWSDQTSPCSSQRHAKPNSCGRKTWDNTVTVNEVGLRWRPDCTKGGGGGGGCFQGDTGILYVLIYSIVPSSRLYLQRRGPWGEKYNTNEEYLSRPNP